MSVYKKGARLNPEPESTVMYRGGETCFHCHQAIWTDEAIEWHGSDAADGTANLMFHPGCAIELSIRLLRDVHQIECRANVEVHLKSSRQAR
jgi:hypothetical protein